MGSDGKIDRTIVIIVTRLALVDAQLVFFEVLLGKSEFSRRVGVIQRRRGVKRKKSGNSIPQIKEKYEE